MTIAPQAQAILIDYLHTLWSNLASDRRPWGVWLRQYPSLTATAIEPLQQGWPDQVWFLDCRGIREQDLWTWRRFLVVQSEQPWCQRTIPEPSPVFGRIHTIGLAGFAAYQDSPDYYIEYIWGGTFGCGMRVSVSASTPVIRVETNLWIS